MPEVICKGASLRDDDLWRSSLILGHQGLDGQGFGFVPSVGVSVETGRLLLRARLLLSVPTVHCSWENEDSKMF